MKNMSQNSTFRRIRKKTHQKTSLQWCISKLSEKRQQFFKEKGGFALVIALGLVALITIFTMSILSTLIETIRATRNLESADEAYYAAEGGLEMGLLANKGKSAGFETNGTLDYATINGSKANWTVQGKTTCLLTDPLNPTSCADSNVYYIPRPGSGNAGANCDPLQTYADSNNDGTSDANHPCNWEKISYGEIVTIPLYKVDPNNPTNILNPKDLNMTEWYLKIRTPCMDSNNPCTRYTLDDTMNDLDGDGFPDDTVILWQIIGEDKTSLSDQLYLLPNDDRDITLPGKRDRYNSEIYEWLVNNGTDNNILKANSTHTPSQSNKGRDQNDLDQWIDDFLLDADINKPIITFQVIGTLTDATNGSIPYLEYQLVMVGDASNAPADMYQTIISEGFSNNFKQSVEMKKGERSGILKFVIAN